MMRLILAAVLVAGPALVAQAETFTFTGTGTNTNQIAIQTPNGAPLTAAFGTSKTQTTYAGGKTVTIDSTCANWPAIPGDIFREHGMCTFTDSTGAGYIRFGCNPAKEAMESNCVGGIWGSSGVYAGRSGTMAWHGKPAPDGKSGLIAGAGQWGD